MKGEMKLEKNKLAIEPSSISMAVNSKEKSSVLSGRAFHLIKAAGYLALTALSGVIAATGFVAFAALRTIAALAMVTIIGIPVALVLWPVYELTWHASEKSSILAINSTKNVFIHAFKAFSG